MANAPITFLDSILIRSSQLSPSTTTQGFAMCARKRNEEIHYGNRQALHGFACYALTRTAKNTKGEKQGFVISTM